MNYCIDIDFGGVLVKNKESDMRLFSLFLLSFSFIISAKQGKPNIVLIMADDVSWEAFGSYGADDYKTPHLDTLAKNMGPYSISKKSSEELINFYSKNYGFRSYIIRFTEVFSMHDNPKNKALIKFISKSKKNENISIDNTNHNFEYISIEAICDGVIKILKNKIKYRYINFYGNKINILSLLMKIKRILNSNSKIIIKKLIKKKSDLKESKILNYKVNKNNLFYSKLKLIIGNEVKNK